MYHQLDAAGSSTEFWEETWADGNFAESERFCDVDPLKPFFARNVRPGSVMLEGGCGRGHYVAHYSAQGVKAIGLDFATKTLAEVRAQYPTLLLGAADVAQLPLRAGTVDTYYSGGVVEHFETGPEPAVAEARRVLRQDGVLLMSVPYFSPLRRMLAPFRTKEWKRTSRHASESPLAGRVFFQYAYTIEEFKEILGRHGFSVVCAQGYSVVWGLYELPLLGRVLARASRVAQPAAGPVAPTGEPTGRSEAPATSESVLKRLVVSEDDSVPGLGLAVRFFRWFAANMMMYECTPTTSPPPTTGAEG